MPSGLKFTVSSDLALLGPWLSAMAAFLVTHPRDINVIRLQDVASDNILALFSVQLSVVRVKMVA